MLLKTWNKYGSNVVLDAQPLNIIYQYKINNCILPCKCYQYENSDIEPFACFNDETICLYASNFEQLMKTGLSNGESNFLMFLSSFVIQNHLFGEFDEFDFNKIHYNIKWTNSKIFNFKFDNKRKILNINADLNKSKFKFITKILLSSFSQKIIDIVNDLSKKMEIYDRIEHIYIDDCYENYLENKKQRLLETRVLGTSYSTNKKSSLVFDKQTGNYKCVVVFSPIILYMNEQQQRILIAHELTHIKVGLNHMHDQYFWFVFKWFSGIDKHLDWTYDIYQEEHDTQVYDKTYKIKSMGNYKLIKKNFKKYKKDWAKWGYNKK